MGETLVSNKDAEVLEAYHAMTPEMAQWFREMGQSVAARYPRPIVAESKRPVMFQNETNEPSKLPYWQYGI